MNLPPLMQSLILSWRSYCQFCRKRRLGAKALQWFPFNCLLIHWSHWASVTWLRSSRLILQLKTIMLWTQYFNNLLMSSCQHIFLKSVTLIFHYRPKLFNGSFSKSLLMVPKITFALNITESLIIPAVCNVCDIMERSTVTFGTEH